MFGRTGRHEGVRSVGDLLAKYKKLKAPQGAVVACFIEVTTNITRVTLAKNAVSYAPNRRVISVRCAGPERQEIMLHARKILAGCKEVLGAESAPQTIV